MTIMKRIFYVQVIQTIVKHYLCLKQSKITIPFVSFASDISATSFISQTNLHLWRDRGSMKLFLSDAGGIGCALGHRPRACRAAVCGAVSGGSGILRPKKTKHPRTAIAVRGLFLSLGSLLQRQGDRYPSVSAVSASETASVSGETVSAGSSHAK